MVGLSLQSLVWSYLVVLATGWQRFFKDVCAHCYCASLMFTQIYTPRHASSARAKQYNEQWSGRWPLLQLCVDLTILDIRCFSLFFPETDFIYSYWQSTHCPKMNKNWAWKVKTFQDFCPRDIESCHLATARCVKIWSLTSNLFFVRNLTSWLKSLNSFT